MPLPVRANEQIVCFLFLKQDSTSARGLYQYALFSYPIFWRQFLDTTVPISSEACPRWNKAYTSIGLHGTGSYLTGSWKIDKWALFFTGKWQAVPYVIWRHVEGCSLSSSLCVFLFFFFLTPLLFKQASEHLNDQNSATWLSAPVLSNLDGYVSASERGRHGRYTYHYTAHAHTRTHTHLPTSPASLLQTGKRLSAYPAVEPGRKVEKCAPQRRCSQSDSCPKPAAICSVRD